MKLIIQQSDKFPVIFLQLVACSYCCVSLAQSCVGYQENGRRDLLREILEDGDRETVF